MSTPPIFSCKEYEAKCIGDTQRALFYAGMALTAVGIAGYDVSLRPFLEEQKHRPDQATPDESLVDDCCVRFTPAYPVTLVGAIGLPYIKAWSITFGIPAICTAFATIYFVRGWSEYYKVDPQGWSPLTSVFRVFVAAALKKSHPSPLEPNQLYKGTEMEYSFSVTSSLRCLDKAAIILPDASEEDQVKRWRLCSVAEVEDAKIAVRMIPMWLTFVMGGIASSVRNTYVIEQANHMDRKVGAWKVPIEVIILQCGWNQELINLRADERAAEAEKFEYPTNFIVIGMICTVLGCITAAAVEIRRLGVVRRHGLLDKPDEDVPMTVTWLIPQFYLLAASDVGYKLGVDGFYKKECPQSMGKYAAYFSKAVSGLGYMSSVGLVYVVGKVSEKGGGETKNWFQFSLNRSRLDKYYWVLSALTTANFILFIFALLRYRFRSGKQLSGEVYQLLFKGESAAVPS